MVRKHLKTAGKIILTILTLGLLHITILANPQSMFSNHVQFGRYQVYSDSAISPGMLIDIVNADRKIRASELYDSSFTASIYMCSNPDLYEVILFLIGKSPGSSGVNLSIFDNTFINLKRIDNLFNNSDDRITYSHLSGVPAQIIAHELTHNLVGNYLGYFKTRKLPSWKSEGYSEYISTIADIRKDTSYSFIERCDDYYKYNLYYASPHSKFYYRSQLLTEFLFEQRNYNFEKFRNKEANESDTEQLLLTWLNENVNSNE